MHKEILTKEQIELLPLIKLFSDDFGLVGGTAIALHMGHRRSIDFDLFTYKISYPEKLGYMLKFSDLLTLAAMKAFSLGRREKWKDYVDLYFIMKDYYKIGEIVKKAEHIFSVEFNEKIFRTQLAYFEGVNYTEKVICMSGFEIDDEIINKKLIEFSLS